MALHSKKAEVTLAFNYITASIIVMVILIFGTMVVLRLTRDVEAIESATFERDFRESMERASRTLYSQQYVTLRGLQGQRDICFFSYSNKDQIAQTLPNTGVFERHPTLRFDVEETDNNVFVLSNDRIVFSLSNDLLEVDRPSGWLCTPIDRGQIEVFLEGLGRTVRLGIEGDNIQS